MITWCIAVLNGLLLRPLGRSARLWQNRSDFLLPAHYTALLPKTGFVFLLSVGFRRKAPRLQALYKKRAAP